MTDFRVPTPDEIKTDARARGLSIAALFRAANVDSSTFYRWKNGKEPSVRIIRKLVDTIAAQPEKPDGR